MGVWWVGWMGWSCINSILICKIYLVGLYVIFVLLYWFWIIRKIVGLSIGLVFVMYNIGFVVVVFFIGFVNDWFGCCWGMFIGVIIIIIGICV